LSLLHSGKKVVGAEAQLPGAETDVVEDDLSLFDLSPVTATLGVGHPQLGTVREKISLLVLRRQADIGSQVQT
jgi:hypothetical protein